MVLRQSWNACHSRSACRAARLRGPRCAQQVWAFWVGCVGAGPPACAHLGQLVGLRLEREDLLGHAVDLRDHVRPQQVAKAADGGDHVHVQPARPSVRPASRPVPAPVSCVVGRQQARGARAHE